MAKALLRQFCFTLTEGLSDGECFWLFCFTLSPTIGRSALRLVDGQNHRQQQYAGATLDTTAALVAEHGLASVTMSKIGEVTGIGRATLYKYFPDVDAILNVWHERQVTGHLHHLAEIRDKAGDAGQRLEAVLEAYALVSHERHNPELATLLHRGEHVARAHHQLSALIRDLLMEGVKSGDIRNDIAPQELASFCLHALTAASNLPSKAAVRRLVMITLDGLKSR